MRKRRKLISTVVLLSMAIALLSGCGGKKQENAAQPVTETSGQSGQEAEAAQTEITFFYPVNIGGAVPDLISKMADDFMTENPGIKVTPVYTGNYGDNAVQVQAAFQAKKPPELFLYDFTQSLSMISTGWVTPLDDLLAADGGDEYINDFMEGFMKDAYVDGKLWSIPFQRSTEILYYNKDAFVEAGLDPEKPPQNWDELLECAKKLTKTDENGNVTRWGIGIDGDNAQWWFGGMCMQNSVDGSNLMSEDGKQVYFNTPENKEALQFVVDLSSKHGVMPTGIQRWTDLPTQFLDGQYGMIYHTSGNLANISENAKFEFGTAFLPGNKRSAACTGGGSFYISEGISQEKKEAAWKFIRFVTSPERQAQWNIDTGYVAVRKSSQDTQLMKDYYVKMPQAKVAMDQVVYAGPELTVYNADEVWDALNSNLEAALVGSKTVGEALDDAQARAEQALNNR